MNIFQFGLSVLVAAFLTVAAWGDDVYVKNRIFKGGLSGTGAAVLVEVEPMLKSLEDPAC